ncbi:MAG TPA: type I secretion system permease/ATPase [Rhodopseudomonas sp.]|uniref:type I secretion system permease/ATPase n=1 Tax=Rhodopseudomonas sp. TaxID=1078 RepID=UPI002ED93D2E
MISKRFRRDELQVALFACAAAPWALGAVSALINLLYLTGSFYMLEVYDRVIPSRSLPTLAGLSILAGLLFGFQALLDLLRSRMLIRIGRYVGQDLSTRVFGLLSRISLTSRGAGDGLQPLRDLDQLRSFLSSAGPVAFLDLPWLPIYLGICFLFHVWIGVAALLGVLFLIALTYLTDRLTTEPARAATELAVRRNAIAEASRRNAEVLHAMGMTARITSVWNTGNVQYLDAQQQANDISGGFGAVSKTTRMVIQSAMLGIGAWLVIRQEATAGVIIAGSIIGGRALAPIDLAIAHWKNFVSTRQSWKRLNKLLAKLPEPAPQMGLPAPCASFEADRVSATPPADSRLVVQDVSFRLEKGAGLGIIGPSGGGKSSLLRLLVGIWPAARGTIRLDGAALDQWTPEVLGQHIGYLPQDVELLAGTIAQNVARFEPAPDPAKIVAAAHCAGVHELIVSLPKGYDTDIGENGSALSAGQRQRIALARALYRDPFLVVLDEPNSNLDAEGEEALSGAILGVRQRGGIVIVVAHRPNALASLDTVMVMVQGRCQAIGPKDEILSRMVRRVAPTPPPATPPAAAAAAGWRIRNEMPGR